MTSPDSAIAPSLLSTYSTASFISASSSSRQSGLQAPTAAQQDSESSQSPNARQQILRKKPFEKLHFTCDMGSRLHPRPEQHRFCASGHRHYDVCPPHRLLCRAESLHRTGDMLTEHVCSLSRVAPHSHLQRRQRPDMSLNAKNDTFDYRKGCSYILGA